MKKPKRKQPDGGELSKAFVNFKHEAAPLFRGDNLGTGKPREEYLSNRLEHAFQAGWDACEAHGNEEVEDEGLRETCGSFMEIRPGRESTGISDECAQKFYEDHKKDTDRLEWLIKNECWIASSPPSCFVVFSKSGKPITGSFQCVRTAREAIDDAMKRELNP